MKRRRAYSTPSVHRPSLKVTSVQRAVTSNSGHSVPRICLNYNTFNDVVLNTTQSSDDSGSSEVCYFVIYCGNQKSNHLKTRVLDGWISNSLAMAIAIVVYFDQHLGAAHPKCWSKYTTSYSPNHLKTRPFEIWTFLSGFQIPHFRSHLKSWPFAANQPLFDHLRSRPARISDRHCTMFSSTEFFL